MAILNWGVWYNISMTLYDAVRHIADRIEHGSLSDPKEILDALEDALRKLPIKTDNPNTIPTQPSGAMM